MNTNTTPSTITITKIDLDIADLVPLMLKLAVAAVPAAIVFSVLLTLLMGMVGAMLGISVLGVKL